jgi:hypothetical protein
VHSKHGTLLPWLRFSAQHETKPKKVFSVSILRFQVLSRFSRRVSKAGARHPDGCNGFCYSIMRNVTSGSCRSRYVIGVTSAEKSVCKHSYELSMLLGQRKYTNAFIFMCRRHMPICVYIVAQNYVPVLPYDRCVTPDLRRQRNTNPVAWVRERPIPTERPSLVGQVSASSCRERGVAWSARGIPYNCILDFSIPELLLFLSSSS